MVFDPDRDEDRGTRPFYARLLVVAVIAIAGCAAVLPAVSAFSAGDDGTATCLAIVDGWHAAKSAPSASEVAAVDASMPSIPARMVNDPGALAQYRSEYQAWSARPDVQHALAYDDWSDGPGRCVDASRHVLIHTGLALGALALLVVGGFAIARMPKSRRARDEGSIRELST
jgi:hypothetical protein